MQLEQIHSKTGKHAHIVSQADESLSDKDYYIPNQKLLPL